ncbi:hypothetical protein Tco_0860538 [Tanacetum coccineum]|uniref:Uncharacterized protein n=1 Tax=Tanacetum coccineum TaxID=301880 RepID=A0ABQ5BFR2_9ASTR
MDKWLEDIRGWELGGEFIEIGGDGVIGLVVVRWVEVVVWELLSWLVVGIETWLGRLLCSDGGFVLGCVRAQWVDGMCCGVNALGLHRGLLVGGCEVSGGLYCVFGEVVVGLARGVGLFIWSYWYGCGDMGSVGSKEDLEALEGELTMDELPWTITGLSLDKPEL